MKKYRVALTAAERHELMHLTRSGKTAVRKLTRARILLKADEGLSDEEIAEEVGTSVPTVERTRRRFVEENLGPSRNGRDRASGLSLMRKAKRT